MLKITPLPTTLEESYEYAAKNGRIVCWAEYGQHIDLTCKNHPELRWSTKNIGYIGARSVFYNLMRECNLPECECKLNQLVPVVPEDWQNKIIPLAICHCKFCGVEVCEESYSRIDTCNSETCGQLVMNNFAEYGNIYLRLKNGPTAGISDLGIERAALAELKRQLGVTT